MKDSVRKLAASHGHVFSPEVVKSVVDLNVALLSIEQNEKSLSNTNLKLKVCLLSSVDYVCLGIMRLFSEALV